MITVNGVTKRFGRYIALDQVSMEIGDGCIYGLVGSNGAGKSTLLRLMTGVYQADAGSIEIDGEPVYDHPNVKAQMMYVPDELYFLPPGEYEPYGKILRERLSGVLDGTF